MARCGSSRGSNHVFLCLLATLGVLIGSAGRAQAQVVQGCQPNQYLDRTASGADRELTWDFGIESDPERCMQVQTSQTVVWSGDLEMHPLGGQGGDMPNPISLHQNGSVTFNAAGTFGFKCSSHSPMVGAIRVVTAPPATVPALSQWLAIALSVILLASGLIPFGHRSRRAAGRSFV